jgi:hypothetical protein
VIVQAALDELQARKDLLKAAQVHGLIYYLPQL